MLLRTQSRLQKMKYIPEGKIHNLKNPKNLMSSIPCLERSEQKNTGAICPNLRSSQPLTSIFDEEAHECDLDRWRWLWFNPSASATWAICSDGQDVFVFDWWLYILCWFSHNTKLWSTTIHPSISSSVSVVSKHRRLHCRPQNVS